MVREKHLLPEDHAMTDSVTGDAISEVFTDVAESIFEAESLYDAGNANSERDDTSHEKGEGNVAATQAAKAVEAAAERNHGEHLTEAALNDDVADETPVVLDAGPAPPDYAAATAWRTPSNGTSEVEAERSEAQESPVSQEIQGVQVPRAEEQLQDAGQRVVESSHLEAGANPDHPLSRVQKIADAIEPAVRTAKRYAGPPFVKAMSVTTPLARAVYGYIEPAVKRIAVAMEPAVQTTRDRLGLPAMRVAQIVQPAIHAARKRAERRLRKVAVIMEPRVHAVLTRVEPFSKRVVSSIQLGVSATVAMLDELHPIFINKRSISFVRRHWLHILLVNVAMTFALLSLVTFVRRPGYRISRLEVFPDYYLTHPRRSHPARFHDYRWQCRYSDYTDFTYTQLEDSGNFALREALDVNSTPGNDTFSLTGRVDIRPAPLAQNNAIEAWINVATTWPWVADRPRLVRNGNAISVPMPRLRRNDRRLGLTGSERIPCVDIWIGIYVNLEMRNFEISTKSFSVHVDSTNEQSSWRFAVKDSLQISTETASILSNVFIDARNTTLIAGGGMVNAKVNLRDSLHVNASGVPVDLTIDQKPRKKGSGAAITPSVLRTSVSGGHTNIIVEKSSDEDGPRNPHISPLNDSNPGSYSSGRYLESRPEELFLLDAQHSSVAGDLTLRYGGVYGRDRWDGSIEGEVEHGSINWNGHNMWDRAFADYTGGKIDNLTSTGHGYHFKTPERPGVSRVTFNASSGDVYLGINRSP